MGVHKIQRLTDALRALVAYVYSIVYVVYTFLPVHYAVLLLGIKFVDVVAVVEAVRLGIVVAETDGIVDPEFFHQRGQKSRFPEVVEGTGLRRHGIDHVARENDKIGLGSADEGLHRVQRARVFTYRKGAAAEVYVGDLQYAEIFVRRDVERPHAVLHHGSVGGTEILRFLRPLHVDLVAYHAHCEDHQ